MFLTVLPRTDSIGHERIVIMDDAAGPDADVHVSKHGIMIGGEPCKSIKQLQKHLLKLAEKEAK